MRVQVTSNGFVILRWLEEAYMVLQLSLSFFSDRDLQVSFEAAEWYGNTKVMFVAIRKRTNTSGLSQLQYEIYHKVPILAPQVSMVSRNVKVTTIRSSTGGRVHQKCR